MLASFPRVMKTKENKIEEKMVNYGSQTSVATNRVTLELNDKDSGCNDDEPKKKRMEGEMKFANAKILNLIFIILCNYRI